MVTVAYLGLGRWAVAVHHPWGITDFSPPNTSRTWTTALARGRAALWGYQFQP